MARGDRGRTLAKSEAKSLPLIATFNGINDVEATEPFTFKPHQHLHFEIIIVERGLYRCTVNREPVTLKSGEIVVLQPGDWHEDFLDPPVRYTGVTFSVTAAGLRQDVQLFNEQATAHDRVFNSARSAVAPLMERLRAEHAHDDDISPHIQDALAAEFFWLLARQVPKQARTSVMTQRSEAERFAARLHQLFTGHVNDALSVPQMASELGISTSALTGKCRTWLRSSPAHAFRAYKMECARSLLAKTEMSVSEVSDHLGFENPYHFSRIFRVHHGRPPSAFTRRR
jgi:AraC-like DNA-binding protein